MPLFFHLRRGCFDDQERAPHDRMQLAVVGIAAWRQGSEDEATIGRDGDRLKGAWFLVDACVMSNTMERCRGVDPANRCAHRHDSLRRLVVWSARLKGDVDYRIGGNGL